MYAEHGHPVLRKKITTSISARGSKNSKQNITSIDSGNLSDNEPGPTGFGRGYKTKVENIILGRHQPMMQGRSKSEVSIQ